MRPFPVEASEGAEDNIFITAAAIVYVMWLVKKYITGIIIRKNV
jgi:hypothetical protein